MNIYTFQKTLHMKLLSAHLVESTYQNNTNSQTTKHLHHQGLKWSNQEDKAKIVELKMNRWSIKHAHLEVFQYTVIKKTSLKVIIFQVLIKFSLLKCVEWKNFHINKFPMNGVHVNVQWVMFVSVVFTVM